jgi:hypothetical protein
MGWRGLSSVHLKCPLEEAIGCGRSFAVKTLQLGRGTFVQRNNDEQIAYLELLNLNVE